MGVSLKKGPLRDAHLLNYFEAQALNDNYSVIVTWRRVSTIFPSFIGYTTSVYDGVKHVPVSLSELMVGHKLGEFVPTRTFRGHNTDDNYSTARY